MSSLLDFCWVQHVQLGMQDRFSSTFYFVPGTMTYLLKPQFWIYASFALQLFKCRYVCKVLTTVFAHKTPKYTVYWVHTQLFVGSCWFFVVEYLQVFVWQCLYVRVASIDNLWNINYPIQEYINIFCELILLKCFEKVLLRLSTVNKMVVC